MTQLLEEAIAQIRTLPTNRQNSIAALILEELHADNDLDFSADRFRESWKQAVAGNTLPLSQLWEGTEID